MILVDVNEGIKFSGMKYFDKYEIPYRYEVKLSGICDFAVIGNRKRLFIERKTIFDFLRSVQSRNNHLFWQLKKLSEVGKCNEMAYPILLIEGSPSMVLKTKYGKRWTDSRIHSVMGGVIAGWCDVINFVFSTTSRRTVLLLGAMDKNLNKEKGEDIPFRINDPGPIHGIRDEGYSMIMGKKGISRKLADKLVNEFGSVYGICTQDEDRLVEVLGQKRGRDFYTVIHYDLRKSV